MKGIIFDIERNSYVDGPGIRTTVFFKGCNLRCAWCHNPESQSGKAQMLFYKDKCTGCGKCKEKCSYSFDKCTLCGRCALFCPHDAREICGKEYSVEEVLQEILKDKFFYDTSGGGVTFSGGECMLQIDFLLALLKECKRHGIHTAVDTAGHVAYESFEKIIPYTDLFLYDVKCYDSGMHQKYTGVGNELILSNLSKLLTSGKNVWVRIPIIPSVNDSAEEMQAIRMFLNTCGQPQKIELLPYHAMGEHKYDALGMERASFEAPTSEMMETLNAVFHN